MLYSLRLWGVMGFQGTYVRRSLSSCQPCRYSVITDFRCGLLSCQLCRCRVTTGFRCNLFSWQLCRCRVATDFRCNLFPCQLCRCRVTTDLLSIEDSLLLVLILWGDCKVTCTRLELFFAPRLLQQTNYPDSGNRWWSWRPNVKQLRLLLIARAICVTGVALIK